MGAGAVHVNGAPTGIETGDDVLAGMRAHAEGGGLPANGRGGRQRLVASGSDDARRRTAASTARAKRIYQTEPRRRIDYRSSTRSF